MSTPPRTEGPPPVPRGPSGATLHWNAAAPRQVARDETGEALAPSPTAPKIAPTIIDGDFVAEPPIRLKPHSRLEGTPYEIVRWLGDGGMGVVLEARHLDLDRRVALKILRTTEAGPVVDLFRQEAKALARLGSEYVVQVFDFVELRDGRLMIAMELVEGEMLADVLSSGAGGGPMALERAIPILRQVCKGLAVAHREGIVHRDVKPANIALMRRSGRPDGVKLLDFGVAQITGVTGSRAGTPGYLAPEVAADVGSDPRADIYAVGCIAYLMLAGRPPLMGNDATELLLAHLSDAPPPPSRFAPVPPALETIVLRCLAKDPDARFARAEELEAALCEAQIALHIHTQWDDLPMPDVEPERRERLLRDMPELDTSGKRLRFLPWLLASIAVIIAVGLGARLFFSGSEASSAELAEVDDLTHRARAAAARAFFVYPPPEQPEEPTAFTVLRELEARRNEVGPAAIERAVELRTEFADTLERLGDHYWGEDGGRPFALDYYAQVLVFDPERTQAKQRASMTPGELRSLREKAETAAFDQLELEAVEPLLLLAQTDEAEKVARLERIEGRQAESSRVRLDKLVRGKKSAGKKREAAAEVTEPAAAKVAVKSPTPVVDEPAIVEIVEESESAATQRPSEADREQARRLTKEGDTARRRGDTGTAERRYVQALTADRRYAPAYAGLARINYDAGNYALAARTADKAVRLSPRNADYRILLGDAHYKSYENAAARNQYQRAAELGHGAAAERLKKVAQRSG